MRKGCFNEVGVFDVSLSARQDWDMWIRLSEKFRIGSVPEVLVDAAKVTAMLMFIIANSYMFSFLLTTEQIPQAASEWIIGLGLPPWGFLLVLNVLLLAAGNFMEPTSVVLILTPIVFPIAMQLVIDPIHLGIWQPPLGVKDGA